MPGQPNDEHSVNRLKADSTEPIPMVEEMPPTLADDAQPGGPAYIHPVGGTPPPSKLVGTAVETSSG